MTLGALLASSSRGNNVAWNVVAAGLIALQALEVKNMKLLEREAVALCATGLTHLTGLEKLDLRGNLLSSRSCAALATTARDLPALSSVHILDADE
jgi:Ran GTPase-activating protein (RanGAP) involved in mRNA processing and transport